MTLALNLTQTILMYIGLIAAFAAICYIIWKVFCKIYIIPKNNNDEKEKISFSKKAVITMFVSVLLFVIVMIIIYCATGGIPDALVEPFFGFFGFEGGALSIIKVSEKLSDKFDKRGKKK